MNLMSMVPTYPTVGLAVRGIDMTALKTRTTHLPANTQPMPMKLRVGHVLFGLVAVSAVMWLGLWALVSALFRL